MSERREAANERTEKQRVEWQLIDITFKSGIDLAALFDAIEPPDDVDNLSLALEREPDSLKRRLAAWGYGAAPHDPDAEGRLYAIGCYGDWTWFEDDERFMPLIAPFVVRWSRAVFSFGQWSEDFKMWEFDGESVELRDTEREVEWL